MSTIIVSEKNKAALSIAEALGSIKTIKKTKNLNLYYVPSKDIYVIPLRGHLLEYRNSEAYKSWTKTNPRDIITDPKSIKKYRKSYASAYINALKEYSKKCDHAIIGTDADIEGVNIGLFDALPFIKKANPKIKVSQLWLSSLQKNEIQTKYNNLIAPRYNWGESGEARALIDAVIGFAATREITNTLRPLLNKFRIKFTSIGRVQTSLLYLIYLREKEINNFIPEPYFIIEAILQHNSGTFKAQHESNPFIKENEALAKKIFEKIKNEKIADVVDNSQKIQYRAPPSPLNTSKALQLLTKNLKITASVALNTMNTLYLNKIISYPRTDSDVYKNDFEHKLILLAFSSHTEYGKYTQKIISKGRLSPTRGKTDAGDHPPITPLDSLELNSSRFENNLQKKVYNLLARHYLALFGEHATESKQVLKLLIKDEPFRAQIVSLVSEGFLEIAPFLKPNYGAKIQITSKRIPIEEILLEKKMTKPPSRYSDTSLLRLMEKNGLGTKSTRPTIIKILQSRKLIRRLNQQYFMTEFGVFLIENLIEVWLPFLKPDFTKRVEKQLFDIKDQKKKMDDVIDDVKQEFLALFDKFLKNKKDFTEKIINYDTVKIKKTGISLTEPSTTTSNCPQCNKNKMKFINAKTKRFLVCEDENCKKFLSLPKNGILHLLASTCSICGFNIFQVNLRKNNKTYNYYLCPKCWNEGLAKNDGKGFCSNCSDYKIQKGECVKK